MNSSKERPGLLFTLVGPAGAGKNSLIQYVVSRTPVRQIPTVTTRPMRPGEQEGREHYFVSTDVFRRMIDTGDLLEHQIIHGNLYGMPRADIEAALNEGRYIIADIEVYGAAEARAIFPDNVVSIFIQAPSIGSLIERMRDRGEREAEIAKRLLRVPEELRYARNCDHFVLNDSFDEAANTLYEIVAARLRGEHGRRGDPLIDYRFAYVAQAIPVYENLALRNDTRLFEPKAQIGEGELPHQAALRALRRELPLDIDEGALISGGKPDGSFVPPVALLYSQDEGGERLTYVYHYRLDKRIDPPTGWSWVEFTENPNAELLERRSEA